MDYGTRSCDCHNDKNKRRLRKIQFLHIGNSLFCSTGHGYGEEQNGGPETEDDFHFAEQMEKFFSSRAFSKL